MTEDQVARLRRGFEAIIRLVRGNGDPGLAVNTIDPYYPAISVYDAVKIGNHPLPGLEAKDHLALSVLLGDEAVLPDALADYLLDQGHEYAVAVAEKARREERRRIVDTIREWAGSAEEVGDMEESQMLLDLAEVVND